MAKRAGMEKKNLKYCLVMRGHGEGDTWQTEGTIQGSQVLIFTSPLGGFY